MRLLVLKSLVVLFCCSVASGEPIPIAEVPESTRVSFEQDIQPIFRRSCLACHSASEGQGGLVLETPQSLRDGGDSGAAIVPGRSGESLLLKLAAHQEESFMPPPDNDVNAPTLTSAELGLIRLWIDQGARGGEMPSVPVNPQKWQSLSAGLNPVYALALSADGQQVAVTRANQLYVYHVRSKKLLAHLTDSALESKAAHLDLIQSLAWSSDGSLLASGGFREVKLWRKPNDHQISTVALGSVVTAVAVSPDRKLVAFAGTDNAIRLWNAENGTLGKSLVGHTANVSDLCFTSDGRKLASVAQDLTIRLWECTDGTMVSALETPAEARAVEFVSTVKPTDMQPHPPELLVTGRVDGILQIWTLPQTAPQQLEATTEISAHEAAITSLVPALDEPMQVFSGSLDGKVRRWDLKEGKQRTEYDHGGAVTDINVRSDGQRLASVSENHTAKLWEVSGKLVAEMKGDLSRQNQAALVEQERAAVAQRLKIVTQRLSSAEEVLAKRTEAEALAVKELEAATAQLKQKQAEVGSAATESAPDNSSAEEGAANEARQMLEDAAAAQLLAEQKRTAAASAVKSAEEAVSTMKQAVAEAETNLQAVQAKLDLANRQAAESERPLRSVQFSPDGALVATAGDFPSVQLWDAETGAAVGAFSEQAASLHPIAFVDQRRLLSASGAPEASVWEINPSWRLERAIGSASQADLISDRVTSLAFDLQSSSLLVGSGVASRSGEISLFRTEDGSRIGHWPMAHDDTVYSVAFSPDGTEFISSGADKQVRLWSTKSQSLLKQFEGHTDYVLGVDWKSDALALISASGDQTLKVWDRETGDQQRTISGFGKDITAVRFVGDSSQVVSSCGDGVVRLHDSANGRAVKTFGVGAWVHCVDATADGALVVAGTEDGRVFLWDGNSGKQLGIIAVGQ